MKIGIDYSSFEDVVNILWCLTDFDLKKSDNGKFTLSSKEDIYFFVRNFNSTPSNEIQNCDVKLRAIHTFSEWHKMVGYDRIIQSQLVENYNVFTSNDIIKEYLNSGNICLSSASVSFEHNNFYYEPFFNLNFFYHFYGMNYLNFYNQNTKKLFLIGTYHNIGGKIWRDEMFLNIKEKLNDDLHSFESKSSNLKSIFEPYDSFGLWGRNHISTYTDFKNCVSNLVFETLYENANSDVSDKQMYRRRYITEKTMKSLLFCNEEIFFIWYGPVDIYEKLRNYGFWFLNSEFYTGSLKNSVYDTIDNLKDLKDKLETNENVYQYLKEKYKNNLIKNSELFLNLINNYHNKIEVLNLIKYGKRN